MTDSFLQWWQQFQNLSSSSLQWLLKRLNFAAFNYGPVSQTIVIRQQWHWPLATVQWLLIWLWYNTLHCIVPFQHKSSIPFSFNPHPSLSASLPTRTEFCVMGRPLKTLIRHQLSSIMFLWTDRTRRFQSAVFGRGGFLYVILLPGGKKHGRRKTKCDRRIGVLMGWATVGKQTCCGVDVEFEDSSQMDSCITGKFNLDSQCSHHQLMLAQ